MSRIFYLALVLTVLIGIPAFAIEFDFDAMNNEETTTTETTEATETTDATTTIDLGQSSDEDVAGALEGAADIEIVNEGHEGQQIEESPAIAEETPADEAADAEPAAVAEEEAADTEAEAVAAEETEAAVVAEEATDEESTDAVAEETTDAEEEVSAVAEEAPDTEEETEAAEPAVTERPPAIAEEDIPETIRNNAYFRESQRLAKLAEETFNYGDYDASANSAQEAIYYAMLSDVFVAIAVAKARIDWAVSSGASKQHPVEFSEAESWYKESITARDAEEWENAIDAAHKVIDILAYMNAPAGTFPLPAKYTVRSWLTVRDCFWNIAGRSWVYGNSHLWRVLYNANKSKLPNPDNPNLIEPGMVLDIPSIKGEFRQGEWSSGRTYGDLPK